MPMQLSYVLQLQGVSDLNRTELEKALGAPYDDSRGFGFTGLSYIDDFILNCILIYSTSTSVRVFDTETKTIISDIQTVFHEVSFELDFARSILVVKGGLEKLNKLVGILGFVTRNKLGVDSVHLSINRTIRMMQASSDRFALTGLIINNYRPNPLVSGRFAAKILGLPGAEQLLSAYSEDISEFTADLEIDTTPIRLRLTKLGAIAINSSEQGIRDCLDRIKDIAMESVNA